MNISYNSYDIFNLEIEGIKSYTFYFNIPFSPYFDNLENRGKGDMGWGLLCEIKGATFDLSTGELYDQSLAS